MTITQDYNLIYDIDQNLSFGTVALTTGWAKTGSGEDVSLDLYLDINLKPTVDFDTLTAPAISLVLHDSATPSEAESQCEINSFDLFCIKSRV